MSQTFTPRYNVYADPKGVATLAAKDNTLVIAAGSPVSAAEADRLKLPELEKVAEARATQYALDKALKPAEISATDAKAVEKLDKAPAKTGVGTTPNGQGPGDN